MSEGDDGASEPPGSPKKPAAPRPGMPGRAKPPPPVPTAAKGAAPLAPKVNPFLERESIRDLDAGWLSPEESAEPPLAPPAPEAPREPTPIPPEIAAPPAPPEIAAPPPPPVPIARVEQTERASLPPPAAKRSRVKSIAFALFAIIAVVGGGLAYQRRTARSPKVDLAASRSSADTTASAEPPKSTAEAVPPPTSTAEPPPSASAPKKPAAGAGAAGAGAWVAAALSADPSKTGIVDTTSLPPGRKIVVDGRLVGTSPGRVVVRCGSHRFQIGDLPSETLDLPCGGELSFTD